MYSLVFKQVFRRVSHVLLAAFIAVGAFLGAVWLPNFQLIRSIMANGRISLIDRLKVPVSLIASIGTNFTVASATYTIIIAVLLGINVSLFVYYIRARRSASGGSVATYGVGGAVSGLFGIGCAACGTFLLSSFLALVGAGGLVAFLPFGGEEFGFLGVGLLGYSVHRVSKKIQEPLVCETDSIDIK